MFELKLTGLELSMDDAALKRFEAMIKRLTTVKPSAQVEVLKAIAPMVEPMLRVYTESQKNRAAPIEDDFEDVNIKTALPWKYEGGCWVRPLLGGKDEGWLAKVEFTNGKFKGSVTGFYALIEKAVTTTNTLNAMAALRSACMECDEILKEAGYAIIGSAALVTVACDMMIPCALGPWIPEEEHWEDGSNGETIESWYRKRGDGIVAATVDLYKGEYYSHITNYPEYLGHFRKTLEEAQADVDEALCCYGFRLMDADEAGVPVLDSGFAEKDQT